MQKGYRLIFCIVCFVCFMGEACFSMAQTTDDLKRIEKQLQEERKTQAETERKSSRLADEIKNVQKQMVKSAIAVHEKEAQLEELESKQQALAEEQALLEEKLAHSKAQIVQMATAMQTLALRPQERMFFNAQDPVNALRNRLILKRGIPTVQKLTEQTTEDLKKLSQTKVEMQVQTRKLKDTMKNLNERTAKMNGLIAKKTRLQAQYDASHQESKKRISQLAGQAKDLKDLLDKLAIEKKRRAQKLAQQKKTTSNKSVQQETTVTGAAKVSSFKRARGMLSYPVRGTIIENYGDKTATNMYAKGITIQAKAGATIIAPFKGSVLFAGPFKSYGKMLIIDNGDNYMTLLAGLDQINASVGQDVMSAEPVGKMSAEHSKLYVEIRKDGQAIDPRPWFIAK